MTEHEDQQTARALGVLEGTVRALMDQWGRQDAAAALQRKDMFNRIDTLTRQVDRVAVDTQNTQQDVAEMRNDIEDKVMPVVNGVKAEQQRRIGAKGVWAMIGAAIVAGGSAIVWLSDKLFAHFKP